MPLGAVRVLSWCGELSLGGILIIINDYHSYHFNPHACSFPPRYSVRCVGDELALVSLENNSTATVEGGRPMAVSKERKQNGYRNRLTPIEKTPLFNILQ